MIHIKSDAEIKIMAEGGHRLGQILNKLFSETRVGTRLSDIEKKATLEIKNAGGTPSFTTVSGYKWATCLCVNDEVVHGIPSDYLLKEKDILTIDIGMVYGGFHTDTANTEIISENKSTINEEVKTFLSVGKKTLDKAIKKATINNRIGHISECIENEIKGSGYSIVKSLVGHGVGRQLHEDPQIPGFLSDSIENTLILKKGMTIAIEIIYAMGDGAITTDLKDGWTIRTKDHSISAVFEHSLAITEKGPFVLTRA